MSVGHAGQRTDLFSQVTAAMREQLQKLACPNNINLKNPFVLRGAVVRSPCKDFTPLLVYHMSLNTANAKARTEFSAATKNHQKHLANWMNLKMVADLERSRQPWYCGLSWGHDQVCLGVEQWNKPLDFPSRIVIGT